MTVYSYDATIPNPPDDPADDVSIMQTNSASIAGIIAVDHVGFGIANNGTHKQVTFATNNTPTLPTNGPTLFSSLTDGFGSAFPGGLAQLLVYSGSSAVTSSQTKIGANGSMPIFGGLIIKWFTTSLGGSGNTVTFASAGVGNFPNNAYGVLVTPASGSYSIGATVGPTQVVLTKNPASGTVNVFVLAIGN